eukprot:TRINITY_DN38903_c0_g1_i1.p1 TRINITY_DN38903_c0_g1~~TRINITY_DN38903_c0_g1_i1.p1  ORF type:complete len:242 (+),score=37.44 TRINITY_DN38903_c0_g1_i1:212-937(+)
MEVSNSQLCDLRLLRRLTLGFGLLSFLLFSSLLIECSAQKPRVRIPNNLDDVVDSEEDEDWKEWGKVPEPKLPKGAYHEGSKTMNMGLMQEFTAAKMKSEVYGWIKLRPDDKRTDEDLPRLAFEWTKLLQSGHIKGAFRPIDIRTIWFQLADDRTLPEFQKNFIFERPEVYEYRLMDTVLRRKGDKPLSKILGFNVWENEEKARKAQIKEEKKQREEFEKQEREKHKKREEAEQHGNHEDL